ncbi:MAG TPA: Rho termination factor N-terminal domain-containing protein [Solirubrobacteraceae bacterium]|nr:Rho termination factor N-terminal domain-containing protein [Solirubrobacteraceae bacterium]
MSVLDRSELQESPLADLHAIADQVGLDGFRRLRKAELIDAILGESGAGSDKRQDSGSPAEDPAKDAPGDGSSGRSDTPSNAAGSGARKRRAPRLRRAVKDEAQDASSAGRESPASSSAASSRRDGMADERSAEGVVELLGNGSAFLRVNPPEPSDEDVYISAAQVRRCELVSGDRVSGPVRTPRRSERYPSLVRIDNINGASADAVSDGARYEDLPVSYPSERLALGSKDPTLEAIEWLAPLGRGSRAVITGAAHAGKTETVRRLLEALSGREDLEVTLVLAGARPEEIAEWQEGSGRAGIPSPVAALSFAASADSQGQAVERAVDAAKRVAARGGHALVLIDSLDGLQPQAARKALAAARNLRDSGSLTVIATATRPFGGETTVIALDVALTSTGRQPILDLAGSGTLKAELLVGEDGAKAITQARAAAAEAAS